MGWPLFLYEHPLLELESLSLFIQMNLVTGANGFLGAHLCATLLLAGEKVRACKRANSSLDEFAQIMDWRLSSKKQLLDQLEWVNIDLQDYDLLMEHLEGIQVVYHCAAVVSFWPKRREEMFHANVVGTATLINACLASNRPRFCHVSSIAALGRTEKVTLITEDAEWSDSPLNSNYGWSKQLAEREVWRGQEEGLSTVIVNPGVILGEGDWNKGSCRFFKMVLKGMKFYTHGQNGYVDVIDVTQVMHQLIKDQVEAERFILVAENIPVRTFLNHVAQAAGVQGPKWAIPTWVLQIAWRLLHVKALLDGKEPLVTKETTRTVSKAYTYSNSKIKERYPELLRPVNQTVDRILKLLQ